MSFCPRKQAGFMPNSGDCKPEGLLSKRLSELILPSIVTTTNGNWRERLQEADELGLTEVALFLSAVNYEERQELYGRLAESVITSIPFVHLRSDMSAAEVRSFYRKFKVEAMNLHSQKEFLLDHNLWLFKDCIYLENTDYSLADEVNDWAGLCLDLSHLENSRRFGQPLPRQF